MISMNDTALFRMTLKHIEISLKSSRLSGAIRVEELTDDGLLCWKSGGLNYRVFSRHTIVVEGIVPTFTKILLGLRQKKA